MIAIHKPKIKISGFRFRQRIATKQIPPFNKWLPVVTPQFNWQWQHLSYIRQHLDAITRSDINRLMIFVPPRHGKSEMTTIRYPVWRLARQPDKRVIIGAYNQTLANKFSRKARRVAQEYRLPLSQERTAVEDWETEQGGGVRAVGVGGGITGQGGDLIIIDDPVKNREEANSETYRGKVWDWYTDDLYTRLEPGGAIILIMTRWHEDDLAGRILNSDDGVNWTVISLPALAETNDPLGRETGAALCPERYNEGQLARIQQVLGNSFYALYQQRPVAPEGEMFKRHWFEILPVSPAESRRVRYWDKAGTTGGGAQTAGVKMAEKNGVYYIEDVKVFRLAAQARENVIRQTAQTDGVDVSIWIEQEPGSGGKESAEFTIRNLAGYATVADKVTGDKITRAEPLQAQAMAGNVKLVTGHWNEQFLNEITSFPQGRYKDQVDATTGAFNKLAGDTGSLLIW